MKNKSKRFTRVQWEINPVTKIKYSNKSYRRGRTNKEIGDEIRHLEIAGDKEMSLYFR